MTSDPFEHEPLERLFQALERDTQTMTPAELREDLRARGLHPEETTAAIQGKIEAFLKVRRLSWQEAARQKQAAVQAAASRLVSWGTKQKDEIEAAFEKARSGGFGPGAQGRLQAAFRNLSHVPTADKASFLDEIELLQLLKENKLESPDDAV